MPKASASPKSKLVQVNFHDVLTCAQKFDTLYVNKMNIASYDAFNGDSGMNQFADTLANGLSAIRDIYSDTVPFFTANHLVDATNPKSHDLHGAKSPRQAVVDPTWTEKRNEYIAAQTASKTPIATTTTATTAVHDMPLISLGLPTARGHASSVSLRHTSSSTSSATQATTHAAPVAVAVTAPVPMDITPVEPVPPAPVSTPVTTIVPEKRPREPESAIDGSKSPAKRTNVETTSAAAPASTPAPAPTKTVPSKTSAPAKTTTPTTAAKQPAAATPVIAAATVAAATAGVSSTHSSQGLLSPMLLSLLSCLRTEYMTGSSANPNLREMIDVALSAKGFSLETVNTLIAKRGENAMYFFAGVVKMFNLVAPTARAGSESILSMFIRGVQSNSTAAVSAGTTSADKSSLSSTPSTTGAISPELFSLLGALRTEYNAGSASNPGLRDLLNVSMSSGEFSLNMVNDLITKHGENAMYFFAGVVKMFNIACPVVRVPVDSNLAKIIRRV